MNLPMWADDIGRDLRYTIRSLRKAPGFTATAILALALGIGSTTAIFGLVEGVLLKPLPFRNPQQLVQLTFDNPAQGYFSSLQLADAEFVQRQSKTLSQIAFSGPQYSVILGAGEPFNSNGAKASANYFSTLGVSPLLGRFIEPAEEVAGNDRVIVLSNGLWRKRFGEDPHVLNRKISLDGKTYRVIGVAGPQFSWSEDPEFWIPLAPTSEERTARSTVVHVTGRRASGFSIAAVNEELHALSLRRPHQGPNDTRNGWFFHATSLRELRLGNAPKNLRTLSFAVALVFLIACANVSGLLLSRITSRSGELSLRSTLGASRFRLFRQLFLESAALSLAAGALGCALAAVSIRGIVALGSATVPQLERVHLDVWTVSFALAIAALIALFSTLVPAWIALRRETGPQLQFSRRGSVSQAVRRIGALFVSAQFAFTLILLIGAGLLLNSFLRVMLTPPGFNPHNLLMMEITLPGWISSDHAYRASFLAAALDRLRIVRGIDAVAATAPAPMEGNGFGVLFHEPGTVRPALSPKNAAAWILISPQYFRTMRIPLIEGREFTERDLKSTNNPAIINDILARRLWPQQSAIGRQLLVGQDRLITIVGVAAPTRLANLESRSGPQVYEPYTSLPPPSTAFLIRTSGPPERLISSVRQAIFKLNPRQPIEKITTMDNAISSTLIPRRFYLWLFLTFAAMALAVAAVGLHGLLAYLVAARTHEIGVRMTVGASPGDIAELLLGFGARILVPGLIAGIAGSLAATRVLTSLLHDVKPTDALTFAAASLVFVVVALVACAAPLGRMLRIDPAVCLRCE